MVRLRRLSRKAHDDATHYIRKTHPQTREEVMRYIRDVARQYGGKVIPGDGPRVRVMFSRQLPNDVIAEMHPYYDTIANRPSGVDIWFNVPLIKKSIGTYFDGHEKKAVAGTVVHELCHACHFIKNPDDYEHRMHSGYQYKHCFQKAGKGFKKYSKAVNNDIVAYVNE
jgi:hypothetical protein